MISRKMLLFLLLVVARSDPSSFSGPPGKALILDPGVSLSLCFSAQSRGRVLPDPLALLQWAMPPSLLSYFSIVSVFWFTFAIINVCCGPLTCLLLATLLT